MVVLEWKTGILTLIGSPGDSDTSSLLASVGDRNSVSDSVVHYFLGKSMWSLQSNGIQFKFRISHLLSL